MTLRKLIRQNISTSTKLRANRFIESIFPDTWIDILLAWLRNMPYTKIAVEDSGFNFILSRPPEEFLAHTGNGQKIDLFIDWSSLNPASKKENLQIRELIARHYAVRTIVCNNLASDEFTNSVLPLEILKVASGEGKGVFFELTEKSFAQVSSKFPEFDDVLIVNLEPARSEILVTQNSASNRLYSINSKTLTIATIQMLKSSDNFSNLKIIFSSPNLSEHRIQTLWGNIFSELSAKISE